MKDFYIIKRAAFVLMLLFSFSHLSFSQNREKAHRLVAYMPEFPGGIDSLQRYLASHVKYPYQDRLNGVEGEAFVQFVIEKDGSVSNVEIVPKTEERATEEMKNEAIRVVSSLPNWKPGTFDDGDPARVAYEIPVGFRLGSGKKKRRRK